MPRLHCVKNRKHTGISLLCLKQLAACMLVRQYAGLPNFGLKYTKDELLDSRFYAQYRSGIGGHSVPTRPIFFQPISDLLKGK